MTDGCTRLRPRRGAGNQACPRLDSDTRSARAGEIRQALACLLAGGHLLIEDLPGVGQVDAEVGDARVAEREEIAVDHPVTSFDEIRDRVPTCFAGTAGEEHSHAVDRTDEKAASSPENGERRRPDRSAALLGFGDSDGSDVLGLVALATLTDVEFDVLALVEGLVAVSRDVGVVDENVLSTLA